MTNGKDNAYPQHVEFPLHPNSTMEYGLSKLEIFAMAAMQGILSINPVGVTANDRGNIAEISVRQAKLLIAELNKETK